MTCWFTNLSFFHFFYIYFGRQNSVCSKSVYRLPNKVEIPPVGRHLQKQQIDSVISSSLSAYFLSFDLLNQ